MKTLIAFAVLALATFMSPAAFAVWNGTFYDPGDTLNPECSPTDVDCDVRPPLTSLNGETLTIDGSTSGTITIQGAAAAGTYTITLPTSDGDASQVLTTDGSGVLSWTSIASGTPTAITVADTADATSYVALFESATGDLGPKTDAGLTYDATTGTLAATAFSGPLTGNVTGNVTGNLTGNADTVTGLSITSGKTLTASNTLTLAGTDGTTMTFPSTSATLARTDAAQTFTGTQAFTDGANFGTNGSGGAYISIPSGLVGSGYWSNISSGVNYLLISTESTQTAGFFGGLRLKSDGIFGWNNSSTSTGITTGTLDTALSRVSAGVVGVGNGTAGDFSGTLKATTGTFAGRVTGHSGSATVPGIALDDSSDMGLSYYVGVGGMGFTDQGFTRSWVSGVNGVFGVYSNGVFAFGSGSSPANNFDAGLSRISAGVVGVGTGAAGSFAGTLKAAAISSPTIASYSGDLSLAGASGYDVVLNPAGGGTVRLTAAKGTNFNGNTASIGYNGMGFADFLNAGISYRNNYPVDQATGTFSIAGNNAYTSAVTNITGGDLTFTAGSGASGSAGAAHGGNVSLQGGTGYGTGHTGYVLLNSSGGNVGIGISSPSALLHVKGARSGTTGQINIEATGDHAMLTLNALVNGRSMLEFNQAGSNKWEVGTVDGTTNDFGFWSAGAGQLLTLKYSNGNVGIGDTSPGAKLSISGSSTITDSALSLTGAGGGPVGLHGYFGGLVLNNNETGGTPFGFWYSTALDLANATYIAWKDTSNAITGTEDTFIRKISAGVIGIGTSSSNTAGTLQAAHLYSGTLTAADALADNYMAVSATTQKGLVIQGKASQTADLQQWQNSGGTAQALIRPDGSAYFNGPLSDTVFNGNVFNGTYSLAGGQGYWAFRTGTAKDFNVDVYNSASPLTAMTVLQSGNVGIGAASPSQKLEVNGLSLFKNATGSETASTKTLDVQNSSGTSVFSVTPGNSTGVNVNTTMGINGGALLFGSGWQGIGSTASNSSGALTFRTNSGSTERMRLTADGYLGIGTTTVDAGLKIAINGAASVPGTLLSGAWFTGGTATTTKPQLLIEPTGTTSTSWSTSGTGLGINAGSGFGGNLLDLQVAGTSKFKVTTTGAVTAYQLSVSDNASANNLSLNGGITKNGDMTFNLGSASSTSAVKFQNYYDAFNQTSGQRNYFSITPTYNQTSGTASNTDLLINRTETAVGSGAQLLIDAQVGSVTKFKISSTGGSYFAGNMGIGVDPSVALDVTGDIEYTGTITDVSDQRLKENIEDFSGALDIITKLDAKRYNMKDGDEEEIGFIAQEVQDIFPGVISVIDPDKGYLGMSYVSLIPVVSEAVKELDLKLESVVLPIEEGNGDSFAERFFGSLVAWFADAGNGIGDFFVNRVRTKELCVEDGAGETCITRSQLEALLSGGSSENSSSGGSQDSSPDNTPSDTVTDSASDHTDTSTDGAEPDNTAVTDTPVPDDTADTASDETVGTTDTQTPDASADITVTDADTGEEPAPVEESAAEPEPSPESEPEPEPEPEVAPEAPAA